MGKRPTELNVLFVCDANRLRSPTAEAIFIDEPSLEVKPARLATNAKRVKWPDVEARAKRIFGDRILPNLVLLEREDEAF